MMRPGAHSAKPARNPARLFGKADARRRGISAAVAVAICAAVTCSMSVAWTGAGGADESMVRGDEEEMPAQDVGMPSEAPADGESPAGYRFDPGQLLGVPETDGPASFALEPGASPPRLSREARDALEQAAAMEQADTCGFVFLDIRSGNGIACHADQRAYVASASKAALSYWAIRQAGETGEVVPEWDRMNIEAAITSSDNDAFEAFGYGYCTQDYLIWLSDHEVEHDMPQYGLYFMASPRGMAGIWGDILTFLDGGTEDAQWLAGLLGSTNCSFIRDGVEDAGAQVWDKAGWIADGELNSTCDAGIIRADGRTYLMAIVTDQPDTEEARQRVAHLARVLFEQRQILEGGV